MDFEQVMAALLSPGMRRLAVAQAADAPVLQAVRMAVDRGLVTAVLFGVKNEINEAALCAGVALNGMEIIEVAGEEQAARAAVAYVHDGRADMLMKGQMQTATLLRAVLDATIGLRKAKVLSHVSVLHSPVLNRMLLLTDAVMVTYPDVEMKAALIQNAVAAARGLGIQTPKVAVLAAIETVNPKMQATLDAAVLTVMNARGQIPGCIVDGPLAMDLALVPEAAAHKGVASPVAGVADILLMPDIDAANTTLKTFTHAGGCLLGGIVMGASAPIVVTSRSDTPQSKLYSIACAAAISGAEGTPC